MSGLHGSLADGTLMRVWGRLGDGISVTQHCHLQGREGRAGAATDPGRMNKDWDAGRWGEIYHHLSDCGSLSADARCTHTHTQTAQGKPAAQDRYQQQQLDSSRGSSEMGHRDISSV